MHTRNDAKLTLFDTRRSLRPEVSEDVVPRATCRWLVFGGLFDVIDD